MRAFIDASNGLSVSLSDEPKLHPCSTATLIKALANRGAKKLIYHAATKPAYAEPNRGTRTVR